MSDLMANSIFEETLFDEFTGSFETETLFSSQDWGSKNLETLNKSLEMALNREDGVESPDSGIHLSNFDFDIESCSALLRGEDPILNNVCGEEKSINQNNTSTAEINTSTTTTDLLLPVIADSEPIIDDVENMDTSDEEEEDDTEERKTPVMRDTTNEIHSYSVMKIKKPRTMKSKRPANFNKEITLTSQGKRFSVSVNKKKRKLYEMEPLNDPVAEKNRLNALNAKKNRDRKKQQLMMAEEEIEKLKEENEELKAETDNYKDQLDAARQELEELKQLFKARAGPLPAYLGNKS